MIKRFVQQLLFQLQLFLKRLLRTLTMTDTIYALSKFPVIVSPNLGNPAIITRAPGATVKVVMACHRESPRKIREMFEKPGAFQFRGVHSRRRFSARVMSITPHRVRPFSYLRSLALRNIFGTRDAYYTVTLRIPMLARIRPPKNFVLLDIIYTTPNRTKITSAHSVCITKHTDWSEFTFYHFTDVHIALRNDEIFDRIATKHYKNVDPELHLEDYFERKDNRIFFDPKIRRNLEFFEFLNRANNFNNNFRQVVSYANREAREGRLDFIIMTGDLVDYLKVRILGGRMPPRKNNWEIFFDMIVGNRGEQPLEVPIFTVVGNHDFRVNAYRLGGYTAMNIASEFRVFRLTREESRNYNPLILQNPLRANARALVDYHRLINPKLDFFLRLGKFHFLFYNSGQDAWVGEHSLRDILGGAPDTSGLLQVQVDWFNQYLKKYVGPDEHVLAFMHAPLFNISYKYNLRDMYRDQRQRSGKSLEINDCRLDISTVSHNRQAFLHSLLGYETGKPLDAIICGHVHKPLEFDVRSTKIIAANDLNDRYLVFLDQYSKLLEEKGSDPQTARQFWNEHKPLIITTNALGPSNRHAIEGRVPSFRKFVIRDGEIVSFKQIPLRIHPYIYLSTPYNVELDIPWRAGAKENWQDFSGVVQVEISNAKDITSSKLLCEIEIQLRGRGLQKLDFEYDCTPWKSNPTTDSPLKLQKRIKSKMIQLVGVMEDKKDWRLTFSGRSYYGGRLFSAFTGIRLRVKVIGVVLTGTGEWRIIGDELLVRKYGISY